MRAIQARAFSHHSSNWSSLVFMLALLIVIPVAFGETGGPDTSPNPQANPTQIPFFNEVLGATNSFRPAREVVVLRYVPGESSSRRVATPQPRGQAPNPFGSNNGNQMTIDTSTPPTFREGRENRTNWSKVSEQVTGFRGDVADSTTTNPVRLYQLAAERDAGNQNPNSTTFASVVQGIYPDAKNQYEALPQRSGDASHPRADANTAAVTSTFAGSEVTRRSLAEAARRVAEAYAQKGVVEDALLQSQNDGVRSRVLSETRELAEKQQRQANEARRRAAEAEQAARDQQAQQGQNGKGGDGKGGGGSGETPKAEAMPEFKLPSNPTASLLALGGGESGRGLLGAMEEPDSRPERTLAGDSDLLNVQPNPVNVSNGIPLNNRSPKNKNKADTSQSGPSFPKSLVLGDEKSTPNALTSQTSAFNPPSASGSNGGGAGGPEGNSPMRGLGAQSGSAVAGDPYNGLGIERPSRPVTYNLVKDGGYASGGSAADDTTSGSTGGGSSEENEGGSSSSFNGGGSQFVSSVPVEPNGPKGLMGYMGLLRTICKGQRGKTIFVCQNTTAKARMFEEKTAPLLAGLPAM